MQTGKITVSVVSHSQASLVASLLKDLVKCQDVTDIIVTQNLPEGEIQYQDTIRQRVHIIQNERPLGFSANHNQAFQYCNTPYFCVVNPDIRLREDPFPQLLECMIGNGAVLAAPAVLNPGGQIEDSARVFPTLIGLVKKAVGIDDGRVVYDSGEMVLQPDWVAGMFQLMVSEEFRHIGGFDEGFFLYYEDVDICARLRKRGKKLCLCISAHVIHDARRSSRHKLRYLKWHLTSMARYFLKHGGRLPKNT